MAQAGSAMPDISRERYGTRLSIFLIVVIVATVLAVDRLALSDMLLDAVMRWELGRFEAGETFFPNRGNFLESEDRLILDEIPKADFSRGGAYFFGSSDLKWSLKTWELPAEVRPFVGNFGLGGMNHTFELQFIRHLVEHQGLLHAGGERNLVVLGVAHTNAFVARMPERSYFGSLWPRHGLYSYDAESGIRPVEMSRLTEFLRTRKARWSGFIGGSVNRAARVAVEKAGFSISSESAIARDPEAVRRIVLETHRNWEQELPLQIGELGRLFVYLRREGVPVTVALLPHRRSLDSLPVIQAYRDSVSELCAASSIPLVDLSRLLNDEDFFDVNHPNARGLARTHEHLMEIVMPHLRAIGVIGSHGRSDGEAPGT
jgi:hypothetical protein